MEQTDSKQGYFHRFQTFIINRMIPLPVQEKNNLLYWRVRILFAIIFTGLWTGIITFVPVIDMVIKEKSWGQLLFDLLALLAGIGLLLIRNLRYNIRAGITLAMIYFMGLVIILIMGPLSGGPAWLFAFAVLVGILLGSKPAIIALIINALTITIIGWSISAGLLDQAFPFFSSTERMIVACTNFMLLNTIVAVSVAVLLKGLDSTHQKEKDLISILQKKQLRLVEIMSELESEVVERKRSEKLLIENENRLSIIFESAPDAFYINDYEGVFIAGNRAAEKLLGYAGEEIIGKNFADAGILSMDGAEKAARLLVENINGKSTGPDEYTLKRKNGTKVTVEIVTHPVKIGGKGMVLGIARDITVRRRAEAERAQLLSAIEQVAETIVITDAAGNIRYANPAFERISGYSREEVMGKNPRILKSGEHDKLFYRQMWGTITAGNKWQGRFINKKKNGTCYTEDASISPVRDGKGNVVNFVAVKRDITDEIRMEEKLRQAQKMEAIGTLAGGIAHQFNNALSVITGHIDLLEMDFPGNGDIADYAKNMKTSARRMEQLTAQLLAYARGGKYQAKTIPLRDFIKKTISASRHAIGSDINADIVLPRDVLNVEADLAQIQMVLSAVLTNSSEAMEGKGCIRVACHKVTITDDTIKDFPGLRPGDYACLAITDNGRGMDEETKNRIFEPFFTTRFAGRGLGMAAAYGIARNHGGSISVDSELGHGTTVKVYLPVIESTQAKLSDLPVSKMPVKKEVKPESTPIQIKGTGTILVIEDEETVMEVSRLMLERLGYRVLEAETGQKALEVVETFDGPIDLAMLDILMPGMTGNKIYPLLMKARPDLKVLIFSGYSIDGPGRELLNAGAEDFIQKPFSIAELSVKLKRILDG